MKGKNKGIQTQILRTNPRAFSMPCGCHSLNLVVGDSVSCSIESKNFFGMIQRIYVLFSASVGRWHILKKHVKFLTGKPLCETRWECRFVLMLLKMIFYQK
jgi:hypothetical protein